MSNAPHRSRDVVDSASQHRRCGLIDRVDPRARILAATAFSLVVAVANRFEALAIAMAVAVVGVALSGLRPREALVRLVPLNLLMLLLVALLPLSTPGSPLVSLGPIEYTAEGLRLAGGIALKGNAIVLVLVVLVGTLEVSTLGHALSHLRVPDKLVHLLLFTVRYLGVLHREYLRLRGAMRVRGFRPGVNRHTYRAYGQLVGMLLVRSLERSQRIAAAMKCRGFRGRFYLLDHFSFSASDIWFAVGLLAVLCGLILAEWL